MNILKYNVWVNIYECLGLTKNLKDWEEWYGRSVDEMLREASEINI